MGSWSIWDHYTSYTVKMCNVTKQIVFLGIFWRTLMPCNLDQKFRKKTNKSGSQRLGWCWVCITAKSKYYFTLL